MMLAEAVECGCRPVTRDCIAADRTNRRRQASEWRKAAVTHRVDAPVQRMQPTCRDAPADRSGIEPERQELWALDGPVLGIGQLSDPRVDRRRKNFGTHSVLNLFG
jgi:hypothetical protein